MSISLSPENVQLKTKGEGQVQSPRKPVIKPTFKMPKQKVDISACHILPNSNVVFVDQQSSSL